MSMSRRIRAVLAATAGVMIGAIAVESASAKRIIPLVDPSTGFNSGWSAEVEDGIDLTIFAAKGDYTSVSFEKLAVFSEGPEDGYIDPLRITFFQTQASASKVLKIADENITNNTGVNWSGFTFKIESSTVGPKFDVAASSSFGIDPFTSGTFSEGDTRYTVSGGVIPDDDGGVLADVWTPGLDSGSLVIDASPFSSGSARRTFVFKEQPLISEQPLIPLPAAAWSALSGLLGIAVVSKAGKVRKLLA